MRLLRGRRQPPYVLQPSYLEGRSAMFARRPREALAEAQHEAGDEAAREAARVWAVVVDLGLPGYVLSIFVFADGTISIYGSGGVHVTGLRGAPAVAGAGELLRASVGAALDRFAPIAAAAAEPAPEPGRARIIARTDAGDLALVGRLSSRTVAADLARMALRLADLAHEAGVEGFEPAEAGEVLYELAPEYRKMRRTLLDWLPAGARSEGTNEPDAPKVAGVAVEFGEPRTVTSVFAFDDGSVAVYSSDGRVAAELHDSPAASEQGRLLRMSVETALGGLDATDTYPLPQPGFVQFMVRTRAGRSRGTRRLRALVGAAALTSGTHPLSPALGHAAALREIATSSAGPPRSRGGSRPKG